MDAAPPRLELRGVSKRYAAVLANDGIDLVVRPGEIHGVLGENGAGKSTLMKIIYGAVHPDAGELLWDGRAVRIASPRQARALGIGMVFQHFALFETLTVAENVWLGQERGLSRQALAARLDRVTAEYEMDVAPDRLVHSLSVGERQRVEIARALVGEPRLLILDEPTSVLTPAAIERLFTTLRRLAGGGCSILYISHKLEEVRGLCQGCTVLRAGRVAGVTEAGRESNDSLARLMLGAAPPVPPARSVRPGPVALEVQRLDLPSREPFGVDLQNVNLTVRTGEVLGIAGISGNGQGELLSVLSGEDPRAPAGSVLLGGQDVAGAPPRARRTLGLCFVPEERVGRGSVPSLSLAANTLLTRREPVGRGGWLRPGVARRLASRLIDRFDVRAAGVAAPAASLSGGNLQKFIVGREVDAAPKVLVVGQPTWGLDVGAAARIRRELLSLADRGCAVLVVSEDLEELFELCSELTVMARGRLSERVPVRTTSMAEIGALMGGALQHVA